MDYVLRAPTWSAKNSAAYTIKLSIHLSNWETIMNLQDIETLTLQYGEGWAVAHVRRVLGLIDQISVGIPYDAEAMRYAAYLHDWGAFPHYAQPGVDHALRSHEIAATEILPQTGLSGDTVAVILEAIGLHDYRCMEPVQSAEALLLREADFLDFLGVVGVLRAFAAGPKDLKRCYDVAQKRLAAVRGRFTIPAAQKIAAQRIEEMQQVLDRFTEESRGNY